VERGLGQVIEFLAEKQNNCRLCRYCNMRENSLGKTDFMLVNVGKAWHGSRREGRLHRISQGDIMKKLLIAGAALAALIVTPALAADMAVKAPPAPVAATVFSWTGFYIGAEAGWGDHRADSTRLVGNSQFLVGTTDSVDRNGGLFGFDVGANYQFNWLVVGVEGDFQWSLIQGTHAQFGNTAAALAGNNRTLESRDTDWIDTITGRLGVAWDRWMIYGKGGGAWRGIDKDNASNTTISGAGVVLSNSTVNSATESGYVIGAGVEWAPSDMVSVKLEGDWYNFGNNLSTGGVCLSGGCGGPGAIVASGDTTTKSTIWEIKGGVNLHYNWLAAH
jgi:outer membrane immunogenic protein